MKLTISWLTIISFVFNLVLGLLSLYQFLDSQKKEENTKAMLRSWQNQTEGITNGLLQISQNPKYFSSVTDMAQSVGVAAQSASSLNKAMSQQRFYSDEEVRLQKEKSDQELKKLMEDLRNENKNIK